MSDFIIPQDINIETSTKVFTEKQIIVLAIVVLIFGGIPAIVFQDNIIRIIFIIFSAALGFVLAKVEVEGLILWDYINLYHTFSREKKVFFMGLLPIKDIKDGIVELEDNTFSSIYEISGVAYDMMNESSKAIVMQSIFEMLFAINKKASFYAFRKYYDISRDLKEIKEREYKNQRYFESYKKMLLETVKEKNIGTVRYFVVFNGTKKEVEDQGNLIIEIMSKKNTFQVRRVYDTVKLFYLLLNIHRSYYQRVEEANYE